MSVKRRETYFVVGSLLGARGGRLFEDVRLPKGGGTARVMSKRAFDRALDQADRKLRDVERDIRTRNRA